MSALDTVTSSFDPATQDKPAEANSPASTIADVKAAASDSSTASETPTAAESPQMDATVAAPTPAAPTAQDMTAWDAQGKQSGGTDCSPNAEAVTTTNALNAPAATTESSRDASEQNNDTRHVLVQFRDGLDLPIEDLEVSIPLPDGTVLNFKTTPQGTVTLPIPANATGTAPVRVKDATGAQQTVCTLDMARCRHAVIVRSPKTVSKGKLRQHQQTSAKLGPTPSGAAAESPRAASGAASPKVATKAASAAPAADAPSGSKAVSSSNADAAQWWGANGSIAHGWQWIRQELGLSGDAPASPPSSATLVKGLSAAGQPVTAMVAPECPNGDCLRLGKDNLFRVDILGAAKRLGIMPQALCALIECEATRTRESIPVLGTDGKQLKDKKGKPVSRSAPGHWDAGSGNAFSNAAGLTQFLRGTWLDISLKPSYFIHDRCVAEGWVKQEALGPKSAPKWVFVLANGKTTKTPHEASMDDANIKACLAKRLDPTWSIYSAADYGAENLAILKSNFSFGSLSDLEKAKLIYLMHHEGGSNGVLFIKNSMTPDQAAQNHLAKVFAGQLGKKEGEKLAQAAIKAAGGDVQNAYRYWLSTYIESKFEAAARFFCTPQPPVRTLSDLLKAIGGRAIVEP